MEFKKDLLGNQEKSYFRLILGAVLLIISILLIVLKSCNNEEITLFDWIYFGLFAMNGIGQIVSGFGYRIEKLFGKAFILINEDKISLKMKVVGKEQTVLWSEIKTINYNVNKLHIQKTDNTTLTFSFSEIEYALKNEIKECIKCIADDKHIITTL